MAVVGRRIMEQADFTPLPDTLKVELSKRIDAVVQGRLIGDDPQRYSKKTTEEIVNLPEELTQGLLGSFGPRIKRVPFTIEGFPSSEEVTLTKDLWAHVGEEQRLKILESAAKNKAQQMGVETAKIPDQTPYAKRLLHRFLQIKQRQD
jgi:hypothetical protein